MLWKHSADLKKKKQLNFAEVHKNSNVHQDREYFNYKWDVKR